MDCKIVKVKLVVRRILQKIISAVQTKTGWKLWSNKEVYRNTKRIEETTRKGDWEHVYWTNTDWLTKTDIRLTLEQEGYYGVDLRISKISWNFEIFEIYFYFISGFSPYKISFGSILELQNLSCPRLPQFLSYRIFLGVPKYFIECFYFRFVGKTIFILNIALNVHLLQWCNKLIKYSVLLLVNGKIQIMKSSCTTYSF